MDRRVLELRRLVWAHYKKDGRHDLPWRKTKDSYRILVSELMLQQTQVARVVPKYQAFIKQFPTIRALAKVPLAEVLKAWQGLGYNRRAKFLLLLARQVMNEYKGVLPQDEVRLRQLPGIGPATATAVRAFAFNLPGAYLETNVRTVFLHHLFADKMRVPDSELLPFVVAAARNQSSREWNWALLDYGAWLKTQVVNPTRKSKHYAKQSKFQGSRRQLRGQILRLLSKNNFTTVYSLATQTRRPRAEVGSVVLDLHNEGLVSVRGDRVGLVG
ncbi:MAG: A/G-specific adenine glycosylase [Candidatus Doudnabacteria bacterium]|nr:A/G-specific adenine glycosylase [Candidatus Doudnabacteria bacterium]